MHFHGHLAQGRLRQTLNRGTMNALCLLYTLMHAVMTRSVLALPSNERPLSITVIPFSTVLNGSMCRPREVMVSVVREFPEEASAVFRPSCVPLQRCSGCCSDPVRECVPIATTSITMQLYKTFPLREGGYEELTFKEHSKCECRYVPCTPLLFCNSDDETFCTMYIALIIVGSCLLTNFLCTNELFFS
uniref:Platelet-derived growth factor (PDGF) family profile domain-containing protein n=1 Tax=Eptatretus burgeri TaxID=7764 RepID=A0A8C4R1D8_EPTBU